MEARERHGGSAFRVWVVGRLESGLLCGLVGRSYGWVGVKPRCLISDRAALSALKSGSGPDRLARLSPIHVPISFPFCTNPPLVHFG